MAIAIIKYALISAIVMASMNCVDCQFLTRVIGVNDIITLLENITTSTSRPNADTQTYIEETLGRVATTQTQMATTQTQTADALTQIATTQTQMATTQTQMATTQTQTADVLTQIGTSQTQMATTQTQMATTQTQMATTQTQMTGALSQVVSLLETQSQQLQNMTATMNEMIAKMTAQNHFISQLPTAILRNCLDLGSSESGSYTIKPDDDLGPIRVYCDMDSENGGWIVFQRRFDGSVDFFLGWDAYEDGFGNPDTEHWLGLNNLHRLTRQGSWTLRVDLEDFQGNTAYAAYDSFSVGNAASFYRLSIGAYSGTARDSLTYHNNQMFSTKDSDHDSNSGGNCAQIRQGAWWYNSCADSNLNGLYLGDSQASSRGMAWFHWKSSHEVLKRAEMKIRRVG